jgi:hypothetical protein
LAVREEAVKFVSAAYAAAVNMAAIINNKQMILTIFIISYPILNDPFFPVFPCF